jgi:hypothetical protein
MPDEEKAKIEKLPGSFLHIHANDMQETGFFSIFMQKPCTSSIQAVVSANDSTGLGSGKVLTAIA